MEKLARITTKSLIASGVVAVFLIALMPVLAAAAVTIDEDDQAQLEVCEAEEAADDAEDKAGEELADHVCNDNCTEEGCQLSHGEKGHECGDDCQAEGGGHSEGDGHDHGSDEDEG